jgi:hypothetical protein
MQRTLSCNTPQTAKSYIAMTLLYLDATQGLCQNGTLWRRPSLL